LKFIDCECETLGLLVCGSISGSITCHGFPNGSALTQKAYKSKIKKSGKTNFRHKIFHHLL
jgi:hypothetical protein